MADPSAPDDESPGRLLDWPRLDPDRTGGAAPIGDEAGGDRRGGVRRHAPVLVMTALLLLWSITCLLPRLPVGPLDLLATSAAAWSPIVILPAVAMVVIALLSRAWTVAVSAAVAGVLPWVFVAGYAIPSGASTLPRGSALRVLLADADSGAADPASLVAATRGQAVDVLVVTEATPMLTHALAADGLDPRLLPRWVSTPVDAARGGLAVYSRYAIVSTVPVQGTRWPAARITLDTGSASLTLVVGRASPPGDGTGRWRSDLTALGDAARTGQPTALVGTLDATPDQSAFRRLTSRGLQDAAGRFGHGLRPTWPSGYPVPLLPLDHVVVGGGVGVRSVSTLPVAGTSHRALVAELVVPSTATTAPGGD